MKYWIAMFMTFATASIIAAFLFAEEAQQKTGPSPQKLYVGMTKEELYKAYPSKYQINARATGNLEVIIFNDYLTSQAGDIITFYLANGKVEGWDKIPRPTTKKMPQKEKLYTGMPREGIYEIYPLKYQLQDYTGGNLEVIIFDDYLTNEAGDTITFYIKKGKVIAWDKNQVNATPEERLAAVLKRDTYAGKGENTMIDGTALDKAITNIKITDKEYGKWSITKRFFKDRAQRSK